MPKRVAVPFGTDSVHLTEDDGIDGLLMLASSFLYLAYSAGLGHDLWLLWLGTIGLGLGISSCFPCALTLPAEASVSPTPTLMMGLMLMGSAGEMVRA